jgi:hypothetical protein
MGPLTFNQWKELMMFRKITTLILVLMFLMPVSGCANRNRRYNKRFPGWEQVRIEKEVPNKDCEYKIQEACSAGGAKCYNTYKQRATLFGANVVVITDMARGQKSSGSTSIYNGVGGGGFSSTDSITALADFYYCPNYKFGEQKQDNSK